MSVDTKSPHKSVAELTAYLKQKKAPATYAATTNVGLIMAEVYKASAGLEMVQVNYKTPADAMNDIASGHIDVLFADVGYTVTQANNNRLRALAVSSATRSTVAPEIPTMIEAGVPGMDLSVWWVTM